MRLNETSKIMVYSNMHLLRYCKGAGISIDKLKKCNIEQMGNMYVFVLDRKNVPISKSLIPLDIDLETQPDIVLTMKIESEDNIQINTTDKTIRVLNL